MKKFLPAATTAILFFCGLILPCLFLGSAQAGGGTLKPHVKLTASAASATANGTSTITITATFYLYQCNEQYGNGQYAVVEQASDCDTYSYYQGLRGETLYGGVTCPYQEGITVDIEVSGSATLSKTSLCGGASDTDTFTITSSVAGTKTLTPVTHWTYGSGNWGGSGVSVNFVAPTAPSTPTKTVTPTPTPAAPQPPAPPAEPKIASLTIAGKTVDTTKPVSVEASKPLVLSGTTVPNGAVTLTIHSTPRTVTATADPTGKWSYTLTGLEPGQHYVEASVTDPATKQTSPTAKLLSFKVASSKSASTTTRVANKKGSSSQLYWLIGAALVILGGAGWFGWRWYSKRKAKAEGGSTGSTPTPTEPSPLN